MNKIAVLTSGGDAPGMNAALRAIVRTGIELGYDMYGVRQGYLGLIWGNTLYYDKNYNFFEKENDTFYCIDYDRVRFHSHQLRRAVNLYNQEKQFYSYKNIFTTKRGFVCIHPEVLQKLSLKSNKYIRRLSHQDVDSIIGEGGTILGTSRCPEFKQKTFQKKAVKNLHNLKIDNIIIIGGEGSLSGALALSQYKTSEGHPLKVIGVPGSIDNDIGCTSVSIGTYTAVNTITTACNHITNTASAHKRVFIVDVMGRDCGYLALASFVAAGADFALFRESGTTLKQDIKRLIQKIKNDFSLSRRKQRFIIIKSENYGVESTNLRKQLEKAFENSPHRIGVRITNLGHVVRGAPATSFDRLLACRLGAAAVHSLYHNKSSVMAGWIGYGRYEASAADPGVGLWPLRQVILETKKSRMGKQKYVYHRIMAYFKLGTLLSH
ncbi:MAG: 6-phosphofructokinase [Deltaproteobacteria bacterium]|nr:6-phosphofructokinase [Deltaproteobacteria bacterium]